MATNNAINLGKYTFNAYLSATVGNVTGDGTDYQVICNTEWVDEASAYNNTTGVYTIPESGNYIFNFTCALSGILNTHTSAQIFFKVNSNNHQTYYIQPYNCSDGGYLSFQGSTMITAAASDAISFHVLVAGGTKVVGVYKGTGYWTSVSGFKLL